MSIAMQNEINALRKRVEDLESKAAIELVSDHLATKDELDAFLIRIRAIESKIESLSRKR